jgi:saccharopine dehydrogenase-like NADP-dependent oxidoreductase
MHIVVLGGCGDMGSYVVRDLLEHSDADVTIADYRVAEAQRLARELGDRAQAVFVDANNMDSLLGAMRGADAVVGCIGPFYQFAPKMVRAAITAGVPYVDICDDYGPMDELFAMDEAAREAGVTVITGLGWTPGLSNLLARQAAEQLDSVDEIRIAWAGGAADSKGLAVIMHLLYAITGQVPSFGDGKQVTVPALSEKERVTFPPPLGEVTVYHCGHPEPLTLPRYLDVSTVTLKGGLTPNWNNAFAEFMVHLGLTSTPGRISFLSKLVHSIEGVFGVGGVPASGIRVDVLGLKDGQPQHVTLATTDRQGRLTGIPASIGALMLADKTISTPGVFAPEGVVPLEPFFERLSERGIVIHESSD